MWHPTNYGSLPPKPQQGDPAAAPPVDWGEAAKWWAATCEQQQVSAPNWPQHSSYVQPPTFNARFVNANAFSSPNGTGAQTGTLSSQYAERPFGWHPAAQRNSAPAWNPRVPGAGGWQRPAPAPAAWGQQPPSSAAWQQPPAPADAWSQPGASANWRGPSWPAPAPTAGWPPDVGPFPVSTRFQPPVPPVAPNYVAAAAYPQKAPPSFVNPPHGALPVPVPIAVPPMVTMSEAATTVSAVNLNAPVSASSRSTAPEFEIGTGLSDSGPSLPRSKRRTLSKNEPALASSGSEHHHSDSSQQSAKPIPSWLRDEIEKRERELWKTAPSSGASATSGWSSAAPLATATSSQKAAELDDEMDLEDAHGADQVANAKRKSRWEDEADAEDDGGSSTRSSSVHSPAPSSTRALEESGWEARRRVESNLADDSELNEDLEMLRNSLIRTWMTDWFADVTNVELRRLVTEVIAEMREADGTEQRITLSALAAYASDSDNEDEQAPTEELHGPTPEQDNKNVSNSAQRNKQESDVERPAKLNETHVLSQQADESTKKADGVSAQRTAESDTSKRRNEALTKKSSRATDEQHGERKSARKKSKHDTSSARRRSSSRSRSKSRSTRSRSRSRSRANRSRTQKSRRRYSRSRSRSKSRSRSRSRSRSSSYRRRRTSHSHRHGRR